jgi:hypothetical protein
MIAGRKSSSELPILQNYAAILAAAGLGPKTLARNQSTCLWANGQLFAAKKAENNAFLPGLASHAVQASTIPIRDSP